MPDQPSNPRDRAAVQQDQQRARAQQTIGDVFRRQEEQQAEANRELASLHSAQTAREQTYQRQSAEAAAALAPLNAAQTAREQTYSAKNPPTTTPGGTPATPSPAPAAAGSPTVAPRPVPANPPQANTANTTPQARSTRAAQRAHSNVTNQRTQANANLNRVQNTPAATNPAERDATVQTRADTRQAAEQVVRTDQHPQANGTQGRARRMLFVEQEDHQVLYHDFILYMCGVDVTSYIMGSVSLTMGMNENPNQLSFQLANTGDLFTLTPENVAGVWRLDPDAPFSEYAKKKVYDFKKDARQNPRDVNSGSRRWNLMLKSPIFHRQDPLRLWVHNPLDEGDSWIPMFTGYITGKNVENDYVNGNLSTLSITAADIRDLMKGMRVQRNTVLSQEVREEDELGPLASGNQRATRRSTYTLDQSVFREAAADILAAARRTNGGTPLSLEERLRRCNDDLLRATRNATGIRLLGDLFRDYIPNEGSSYTFAWARMTFTEISHALTVGGNVKVENHAVNRPGRDRTDTRAQAAGSGGERGTLQDSIGRFREGLTYLYPDPDAGRGGDRRSALDVNRDILEHWYKLCLFGSPIRNDCTGSLQTRLAPNMAQENLRFWTEAEVHLAGELTVTDGVWAPDMQLTHWLLPRQGDGTRGNDPSGTEGLFDATVLGTGGSRQTNVQREFTNRIAFLSEIMQIIDYRMWVTGVGDIVFEFPMYDFYPDDFGLFQGCLEVDGHLLNDAFDDEHGEYPTVVLVQGTFTGLSSGGTVNSGSSLLKPPTGIAMAVGLASRRGFVIDRSHTFPYIRDQEKLDKIAKYIMQREIMKADSFSLSMASRVFITPNRPIHDKACDRMSLANSVTHTWDVFGESTTALDLEGSRALDINGVRRSLTGGRSLPVSFAQIPGADNTANTISGRRTLQRRVSDLLDAGLTPDDIVFGIVRGHQVIPAPVVTGDPSGTPKDVSAAVLSTLNSVRSNLAGIHVTGSSNHPGQVMSIEDQRRRFSLGSAVTAADILNQAVSYDGLPEGDVSLNVVDGFETDLTGVARPLNPRPTSTRNAVAVQNEEDESSPQGLQPPYTDGEQHQASTAVVNIHIASPSQRAPDAASGYSAYGNASRVSFGQNGAPESARTSFLTRVVPARRIIYGCNGVAPGPDWYRRNNAAMTEAIPGLTQEQRNFFLAFALIESSPGSGNGGSVFNYNFFNIKAYPNNWQGKWCYRAGGRNETHVVPYRAYPSAGTAFADMYHVIRTSGKYDRAFLAFSAGDPRWIAVLYAAGWSEDYKRYLARNDLRRAEFDAASTSTSVQIPEAFVVSRTRDYRGALAEVRRYSREAINAPACDGFRNESEAQVTARTNQLAAQTQIYNEAIRQGNWSSLPRIGGRIRGGQ